MKAKLLFTILLMAMSYCTFAQTKVTLTGKIIDGKVKEDVIGAYVKIFQKGIQKAITASDFEGYYAVVLSPDVYDIEISYVGLKKILIKNVSIDKDTIINFEMESTNELTESIGCGYIMPIISIGVESSGATYTSEQIMRSPR